MSEREIFTKLKNPQLQGGSMRFVDLFCGIGGFHHALSDLNHECVFACDIDKDCNEVYLRNWQMRLEGGHSQPLGHRSRTRHPLRGLSLPAVQQVRGPEGSEGQDVRDHGFLPPKDSGDPLRANQGDSPIQEAELRLPGERSEPAEPRQWKDHPNHQGALDEPGLPRPRNHPQPAPLRNPPRTGRGSS